MIFLLSEKKPCFESMEKVIVTYDFRHESLSLWFKMVTYGHYSHTLVWFRKTQFNDCFIQLEQNQPIKFEKLFCYDGHY